MRNQVLFGRPWMPFRRTVNLFQKIRRSNGTVGEKCHYTEVLIKPKYRIFKLGIYWSQAHFLVINGSNLILLITKIAMWKCFGAMVWHSATRVPMQYSTYRHTARSASRHWFYCVLLFKFSFFGKYQIFTRFYHL